MSYGRLVIRVPDGTDSAKPDRSDVIVEVKVPSAICAQGSSFESSSVDKYKFGFNVECPLKGPITSSTRLKINLYEHNRFMPNTLLGTGEITLDALAQGGQMENQQVQVGNTTKVNISLNWKGAPEGMFSQAQAGGSAAAAGQAGNSAAGGASGPGGGGDGGSPPLQMASRPGGGAPLPGRIRPLPDPNGQNYGVRVKIHRLKNLQSTDPEKLYSPKCILRVAGKTYKTDVVKNNNEPTFDEETSFNFEKVNAHFWTETLSINAVSDRFGIPDEKIGLIQFDLGSIYRSNAQHAFLRKWFVICKAVGDGTVMGYAKASVAVFNLRSDPVIELDDGNEDDVDDEDEDDIVANLIHIPGAVFEEMNLNCRVVRATGLPKMDAGLTGSCDGYVKVSFGTESRQTAWIDNTYNPTWNSSIVVPCMMPMLTNFMQLQLWDHDVTSPDDLIATHLLDVNDMREGRTGKLPNLYPRFFNFYGHPRACDADLTSYYKKMARGLARGVDFRGRALIGFNALRKGENPVQQEVPESTVKLSFKAEILQLSHLACSDEVKIKAFCGTMAAATSKKSMTRMKGEGPKSYCAYIGQAITFNVEIPVIIPPHDNQGAYLGSDQEREDRAALNIWRQIPDIVVHIIPLSTLGRFADAVTGAKDEEPIASLIIPATKFYEADNNRVFISKAMDSMQDPEHISDGSAPTNPLIQINASLCVNGVDNPPPHYDAAAPHFQRLKIVPDLNRIFKEVLLPDMANLRAKDFLLQSMIYHAKSVPSGDSDGTSDPYVVVSWANCSGRTGWKASTLNPEWNEVINSHCGVFDPLPNVMVEIWDRDPIGSDTFLCKCLVDPRDIARHAGGNLEQAPPMWLSKFTDGHGEILPDTALLVKFNIMGLQDNNAKEILANNDRNKQPMPRAKSSPKDTYQGVPIQSPHRLPLVDYKLDLKIMALRKMRKFRLRKISTPSISFEVYGHRIKCDHTTADEFLNFNQEISWNLQLPDHPQVNVLPNLSISVFDRRLGSDSLVAVAQVPLDSDMLSVKKKKDQEKQIKEVNNKKLQSIVAAHRKMMTENEAAAAHAEQQTRSMRNLHTSAAASTSPREVESKSRSIVHSFGSAPTAAAADGNNGNLSEPLVSGDSNNSNDDTTTTATKKKDDKDEGAQMSSRWGAGVDINDHDDDDDSAGDDGSGLGGAKNFRNRIARAIETQEEAERSEYDVASDVSSEPDEPLWFDRFEPAAMGEDEMDAVRPEQRVARFGKLGRYSPHFRNGKTTAEDVYGPFNDGKMQLQLHRGWGSKAIKAGSLLLEANLDKLGMVAGNTGATDKQKFKQMDSRKRVPFMARVYVLQCRDLTAMDSSILTGKSSDPYVVLRLSSGSDDTNFFGGSKDVVVSCKDQVRYQVTDPDFFFVRELSGELPRHSSLRVSVFDSDKIGRDELIGFTDINMEERYYSMRGYSAPRPTLAPGIQTELQDMACFYNLNNYGCYSERRRLANDGGLAAGTIELWIDLFDFNVPVPRPIDVAPPPPIPVELRVTVWNVRDCELTDEAITGELMTDIYVRCWVDGMASSQQNTDVHYRSLDGTGSFNWRMLFPIVFDPRLKKVFPYIESNAGHESGGAASTAISSFFSLRKEAKKLKPRLKVQLWDNDLFPGTDDYIGDASLDMTALLPAFTRRDKIDLARGLTNDCRGCWNRCPCSKLSCCQCEFCKPKNDIDEMTLEERQEQAREERRREKDARIKQLNDEVDLKIRNLKSNFNADELPRVRDRLFAQSKKASKVNVFKEFLPQRRKKSQKDDADAKFNAEMQKKVQRCGVEDSSSIASKADNNDKAVPPVAETPRQWFICRSPNGGCRVGDVQLSFELVRLDALEKNPEKLQVGKGRSEPQAMPEPDRPDSSFFWLSSPWKAAVHIAWKNYKYWILTILCIVLAAILVYDFMSEGVMQKSRNIFT